MASQKRPVAMVTGGTRGIGSGEVGLTLIGLSYEIKKYVHL